MCENETQKKKQVCSICLTVGARLYMSQNHLKFLLESICPNIMTIKLCRVTCTCYKCFTVLMDLKDYKRIWLEVEDKIRTQVVNVGQRIILSELLFPDLPTRYEIHICRLCLTVVHYNSSSNLSARIDNISLTEMFRFALPEILLDLTYSPILCDVCAEKLHELYKLKLRYMDTEMKIKRYWEVTGTKLRSFIDNANLLLNVIRYFQAKAVKDKAIPKSTDFVIHFCDCCEYKTPGWDNLQNHRLSTHPVQYMLDNTNPTGITSPKASTSGGLTANVNSGESSITPSAAVGKASITPSAAVGKASITPSAAVGKASIIPFGAAIRGKKPSNIPSHTITSAGVVNGGGTFVFLRKLINIGELPKQITTGNVDTKSIKDAGICSTSSKMGINEKKFKCTLCNKYASDKKCNYKQHVARHNKLHSCLVCDFKGTTKKELIRHNLEHFPDRSHAFRCHKCTYCTATRTNLTKHLLRHNKKESQPRIICSISMDAIKKITP